MFMLQAPQLPKPEDIMNAFHRAGAQSVNGLFLAMSAPIEFVKGLGIPVPELPAPPTATNQQNTGGQSGFAGFNPFPVPLPWMGGQVDVTYEPYTGSETSVGGQEDVTLDVENEKQIWV